MSDARIVELTIPGSLAFRDLALRVVWESCKLVTSSPADGARQQPRVRDAPDERFEIKDPFGTAFVSAFSEIYNNIPIHAYRDTTGHITLKIHIGNDRIAVDITDTGKSFDIGAVPPPEELPTGGMGIHIARSMLDELIYEPGPPNRWRLIKYISTSQESSNSSVASSGARD